MEEYIQQQMELLKEWWGSSLEEVDYKNLEKFIREIYIAGKESVPAETLVRQGVSQPVQTAESLDRIIEMLERNRK